MAKKRRVKAKGNHTHGKIKRHIRPELPPGAKKWAPLSTGFLAASIIGFFISLMYIRKFSISLSIAFSIVFFCMFLASMISMARASPDAQLSARPIK